MHEPDDADDKTIITELTAETANESCSVRFQLFDEEKLAEFVASSDRENTKNQIKYSVTVFEDEIELLV